MAHDHPHLSRPVIALLQRVRAARVDVDGAAIGAIDRGLLVFLGVERGDSASESARLAERVLGYRVFADEAGRMNLDVSRIEGGILVVPQFTLAADTSKGLRPSFTPAAEPAEGQRLYDLFVSMVRAQCSRVATGRFGADMQVTLTNDGPVTFWLQVAPGA